MFGMDKPGLAWDDYNGYYDYLDLANGAFDPDVVVVEGRNSLNTGYTWYAIVVQANIYNECICAIYEWDPLTVKFVSISTNILQNGTSLTSDTYETSINIDADAYGNFVIVWDDATTNDIQIVGGTYPSDQPHIA